MYRKNGFGFWGDGYLAGRDRQIIFQEADTALSVALSNDERIRGQKATGVADPVTVAKAISLFNPIRPTSVLAGTANGTWTRNITLLRRPAMLLLMPYWSIIIGTIGPVANILTLIENARNPSKPAITKRYLLAF